MPHATVLLSLHTSSNCLICPRPLPAGKGRGVVATRDIAIGEAVLCTPPAAIIHSKHQQRPFAELVVDKVIDEQLYTSRWFDVLYDGSIKSTKLVPELRPSDAADVAAASDAHDKEARSSVPEPILASSSGVVEGTLGAKKSAAAGSKARPKTSGFAPKAAPAAGKGGGSLRERLLKKAGAAEAAAEPSAAGSSSPPPTAGGAGGGGAAGGSAAALDKQSTRRLAKLVKFNCFGDDAGDLAACASRGEAPTGHVGLWPEFALLNHSCSPNTVNYVIGCVACVAPRHMGHAGQWGMGANVGRCMRSEGGGRAAV